MNKLTYHRRKAQGLCVTCGVRPTYTNAMHCPTHLPIKQRPDAPQYASCQRCWKPMEPSVHKTCPACRTETRTYARATKAHARTPGPLLWCCGDWHPITSLPFVSPCCGHLYLEHKEDAA